MRKFKIRVALLSGQRLLLEGVAALLATQDQISVVGSWSSPQTSPRECLATKTDVIVFDVAMAKAVQPMLLAGKTNLDPALVLLADRPGAAFIELAAKLNAVGCLVKSDTSQMLIDTILQASVGKRTVSAQLQACFCPKSVSDSGVPLKAETWLAKLTRRQREVLYPLAQGHSVREISGSFMISDKSVDSHKYRLMKALDINDRVKLALFAVREGLIEP